MTQHKFPPSQTTQNGRSATGAVPSSNGSKDKYKRSKWHGNSWKVTDRTVDVPVVLKRQCQPAQVLDRAEDVPTTGAKDAKV